MDIKIGDHIRAFLKKGKFAGREASPFAGRDSEEVTGVNPGGGCKSQPAIITTKFSDYRLDEWDIMVVPAPEPVEGLKTKVDGEFIESFAKIEPVEQVVCYKVMGITSPYSVVACYSQPQHPDKVVCELRGPTKANAQCDQLNRELEEQRRENVPQESV